MSVRYSTPIPNEFFDKWMGLLPAVSIRVFLKIARNTLGWRDSNGWFKQRDWISHSQFGDIGVSSRSVTTAIDDLLNHNLIIVTDEIGNSLHDPKRRKKAHRIYYGVHPNITENFALNNEKTKEKTPQNFLSTKEIDKRKYKANERIPDHARLQQILMEEEKKQSQRDRWV